MIVVPAVGIQKAPYTLDSKWNSVFMFHSSDVQPDMLEYSLSYALWGLKFVFEDSIVPLMPKKVYCG